MSCLTRPTDTCRYRNGRKSTTARHLRPALAVALVLALGTLLSALPTFADDDTDLPRIPYPTESLKTYPLQTRGDSELDKLDTELRKLYEQYAGDRRNRSEYVYSSDQLTYLFGIDAADPNPLVRVAVTLAGGADAAELADAGVTVLSVNGDLALVSVPVVGLQRLARHDIVVSVEAVQVMRNPAPPARVKMSLADKVLGMRDAEGRFNGQGPAFDDQGPDRPRRHRRRGGLGASTGATATSSTRTANPASSTSGT